MSDVASSEPQSFHCPTCGASLPTPRARSVKCEYCGSNVLVPPEYLPVKHPKREATPEGIIPVLNEFNERKWASPRVTGGMVAAIIVFIVLSIFSLIMTSTAGWFTTDKHVDQSINATATWMVGNFMAAFATQVPTTDTPTPFPPVKIALKFGGEGSGPGLFDDPRYIALDPDNNIFIADYSDGRVQKFDPNGKFLQLINIEPDQNQHTTVRDMATNYNGELFIVRGGDILVYGTADGKLLNTIHGKFPDIIYDKLAIDAANNLYAISEGEGFDDLIKLDPEGKQIWMKHNFLNGVAKENTSAYISILSIDGLGNTFILNGFNNEIYEFDNQGSFVDRFGSKGNGPQQLNTPYTMAVDGQGRIFLVDSGNWYTIKVFDSGGTFLGAFSWPDEITAARDIVFDMQGNLYTVSNTAQVARMTLDMGNIGN